MTEQLNKININNEFEFYSIIDDLINNETVRKMKNFKQHYDTSTYDHCLNVAYLSYIICKKLNLDYKSATRAAMLHDLFLYDWRNSKKLLNLEKSHAFIHPKIALDNASKLFTLNEKEKDIILKHMWPVTISLPKYKESYIITFTDKFSTLKETYQFYDKLLKRNKIYKYAYVFFCLLLIKV